MVRGAKVEGVWLGVGLVPGASVADARVELVNGEAVVGVGLRERWCEL